MYKDFNKEAQATQAQCMKCKKPWDTGHKCMTNANINIGEVVNDCYHVGDKEASSGFAKAHGRSFKLPNPFRRFRI